MRVLEARELFRQITAQYFNGASVIFSNQSRAPKPQTPLVVITPGNVRRPQFVNLEQIDDTAVGNYLSRISMTVDLFTNGQPVTDPETGLTVAYENSAMDEMLAYVDFLDSDFVTDWSRDYDITILQDGEVQELTGLVNDTSYEYRSRVNIAFYFTQKAVGHAAVLSELSIQENDDGETVIEPTYDETSIGGTDEELTSAETGYFTDVEIKEETV